MEDRAYLIVDVDAIIDNLRYIRSMTGGKVKLMLIAKANCYGLGAEKIIKYVKGYVDAVGVATIDEGINIRKISSGLPVLILGYTPISRLAEVERYGLSQSLYCKEYYREASEYCKKKDLIIKAQIAFNTGMNRLGFDFDEDKSILSDILKNDNFEVEGIYSHLCNADTVNNITFKQIDRFSKAVEFFADNKKIKYIHLLNSAGTFNYRTFCYNTVRIGISAYGLEEFGGVKLKPCLKLFARIAQINHVKAGSFISYGAKVAEGDMTLATVCIGYADGLPRFLSDNYEVEINGSSAKITGKICMDYFLADVSEVPTAKVGDYVEIVNGSGLPVNELTKMGGTISYEFVTGLNARLAEYYVYNGKILS